MRAPKIVREFFEWRWGACLALIVGALSFVVLALLLIPTDLGPVRAVDLQRAALEPAARAQQTSSSTRASTPERFIVAANPAPVPASVRAEEQPVPLVASEQTAAATRAVAPDFASNISDRADRPTRPHERSQ